MAKQILEARGWPDTAGSGTSVEIGVTIAVAGDSPCNGVAVVVVVPDKIVERGVVAVGTAVVGNRSCSRDTKVTERFESCPPGSASDMSAAKLVGAIRCWGCAKFAHEAPERHLYHVAGSAAKIDVGRLDVSRHSRCSKLADLASKPCVANSSRSQTRHTELCRKIVGRIVGRAGTQSLEKCTGQPDSHDVLERESQTNPKHQKQYNVPKQMDQHGHTVLE